jgi:hypothetical protein
VSRYAGDAKESRTEYPCYTWIAGSWQVFVVDRAGSVATQWNTVIEHDKMTTPWPLPFEEYLNVSRPLYGVSGLWDLQAQST